MKTAHLLIGAAVAGVAGYFLFKRYKDYQRAQAHPLTVQSDAQLIRPLPINPALVTDAKLVM